MTFRMEERVPELANLDLVHDGILTIAGVLKIDVGSEQPSLWLFRPPKPEGLSSADLTTVQGGKITYRRMFRKDFIDNAFCAVKASPPRTSYQGNIKADNGIIHMINEVIYPGWSESSGGYGGSGSQSFDEFAKSKLK